MRRKNGRGNGYEGREEKAIEKALQMVRETKIKRLLLIIGLGLTISCTKPTEADKQPATAAVDSPGVPAESPLEARTGVLADSIRKPTKSHIINPAFALEDVFGVWTTDPNGPHADFTLDSTSFYIVDSDGNGNMPYILREDSLIIFYDDFIGKNKILKADQDSLLLQSEDGVVRNVRWKE